MNKKVLSTITAITVASTSFVPALPVMAATAGKKAIAKYDSILSKSSYPWTSYQSEANKTKNYRFALYDVNHDGVKELFLNNTIASHAEEYALALTYKNGKIRKAGPLDEVKVYKKSRIVELNRIGGGGYYFSYFQLKNGKWIEKAHGEASDSPSYKTNREKFDGYYISYRDCKVNGKKVSYKQYKSYVKKLLKHDTKTVKLKYHKNTAANRKKYLK